MNIIEQWDEAAKPNESGLHNGGGFALNNWREIRAEVGRLRMALYGGAHAIKDALDVWEASGDDDELVNNVLDPWASAILDSAPARSDAARG